ncbi:restriction endonuclease [Pseudomonas parafulva]|uniref:nSTAND3 domain-containing NTPase n=1 Tax=Pseudomonas parafulva TaxID=157782 RepID=UPI0009BD1A24|nr:restriction endonuclease [Pseudomonas parafulva]
MNDYDFSRLNDKEFEVLATDLISAYHGNRFERFKPGRDGGVDGRYFSPDDGEWILQAKHWPATPFTQLISHIKNTEAPKAAHLNPEHYILVVSNSLSPANKTQLASSLQSHISCPIEIFGKEDLNDLLSKNPAVERRHFKLWLSSSTVLSALLNNAIHGRSESMMREICAQSKIHVKTPSFDTAADKLNQLGTVIITGEPGIGKTTLAEQLILQYSSEGYELNCIAQDIREAEQSYDRERPQLFYFDDFLGRNYLQALTGHEGSQIVHFIKRISSDKATKKFVLTSRSTILNQGRILNDVFEHNNINRNEMEIKVDSLSSLDKARILYNHIWHSGLSPEHIEEFYTNRRYAKLIDHKNFNPRIIQFITDPQRVKDLPPSQYWAYITELFKNPAKVWEHPFEAQLDDYGRLLVILVAFNGESISESELADAYARYLAMPNHSNLTGRRDFHIAIRHLCNSLLTRVIFTDTVLYKLFNPSLGDFLLHRYSGDIVTLEMAFKSLRNKSGLEVLSDMSSSSFLKADGALRIYQALFYHEQELNFQDSDPEYVAHLWINIDNSTNHNSAPYLLENTLTLLLKSRTPSSFFYCLNLLLEAIARNVTTPKDIENFVAEAVQIGANDDELPLLAELVFILQQSGIDTVTDIFAEIVQENLLASLSEYFEESDVFRHGYDFDASQSRLAELIVDRLANWHVEASDEMIDHIIDAYDIKERMNDFFASNEYYRPTEMSSTNYEISDVDDLFERDH